MFFDDVDDTCLPIHDHHDAINMFTNSWPHDLCHPSRSPDMLSVRLPGNRELSRSSHHKLFMSWSLKTCNDSISSILIRMLSFKSVAHVTATQVPWTLQIWVLFFTHQSAFSYVNSVGGASWWVQLSNENGFIEKKSAFANVLHVSYMKCIS